MSYPPLLFPRSWIFNNAAEAFVPEAAEDCWVEGVDHYHQRRVVVESYLDGHPVGAVLDEEVAVLDSVEAPQHPGEVE